LDEKRKTKKLLNKRLDQNVRLKNFQQQEYAKKRFKKGKPDGKGHIKDVKEHFVFGQNVSKSKPSEIADALLKRDAEKFYNLQFQASPIIKVTPKNEVLDSLRTFDGEYMLSSIVNGKHSYVKDLQTNCFSDKTGGQAIWYDAENDLWIIGDVRVLGSKYGFIISGNAFGGLTDGKNEWHYSDGYSDSIPMPRGKLKLAQPNDINIQSKCQCTLTETGAKEDKSCCGLNTCYIVECLRGGIYVPCMMAKW